MKLIDVKQKVREVIESLGLPLNVCDICDNDALAEKHGFDSIVFLEYMILVEEKFGIVFQESFEMKDLYSIQSVSNYIISVVKSE